MDLSDAELMRLVRDGHPEAFAELVRRHEGPLVNFFYRLLWDRHAAEDCAQEVFLRVWQAAGTWVPSARFTTWLYRIARNHWIDRLRSAAAAPRVRSYHGSDAEEDPKEFASAAPSPADRAAAAEEIRRLRAAIQALPETHRMVVVLGEFLGLPYAEVAEILDIPVGTVKSRMFSALVKIQELLDASGGGPSAAKP
jgi:RNA polymerase sigma-70 factor (ECF subfamily)